MAAAFPISIDFLSQYTIILRCALFTSSHMPGKLKARHQPLTSEIKSAALSGCALRQLPWMTPASVQFAAQVDPLCMAALEPDQAFAGRELAPHCCMLHNDAH